MYLGALILLYRQLLVATTQSQQICSTGKIPFFANEEARRFRDECTLASQQIARLLGLISFDGTLTKRCWIVIYWSFTAATILLFSATTKIVDGQSEGVDCDLAYAKDCLAKLDLCRTFEPLAARYLQTLRPIYDALRQVHQRLVGRSKASIWNLVSADPSQMSPPISVPSQEMGPISEKLVLLINDPFGRKQGLPGDGSMRRVLNADGSCSVFWWK